MREPTEAQVAAIRAAAVPLTDDDDYSELLALIGDARIVLLGEASHGTHEFYRERARITQRLFTEKGFNAVAVEADWPDAYRVNRFVRGAGDDASAAEALSGFQRFPAWMWRNEDVVDFVDWQRAHNVARPPDQKTGFYGLDLYSLHSSMEAVLHYLDRVDPDAARRARDRYACFDHYGENSQSYGLMTGLGGLEGCEDQVVATLVELRRRTMAAVRDPAGDGSTADAEEAFNAEQNARLVRNAEAYYRSMYLSDVSSWNQRDRHMGEALAALERHLGRSGTPPRIVVWAHNSHLGDARATEMGQRRGELNLGQLVRERHGDEAFLMGFSTHDGTVTAASDWDAPPERKRVHPSLPDSYEHLLHATRLPRFLLPLSGDGPHLDVLHERRLERAIGVIYRPETERQSHYFFADLPAQFDAMLHIDRTQAVQPLDTDAFGSGDEPPETYPAGV